VESLHSLLENPDIVVTTPISAAKYTSLVLFVGACEDLRELVSMAGDLKHKIVVDVSERAYGTDESGSIFGADLSVVRIERETGSGT
jgi:hypothetical protein